MMAERRLCWLLMGVGFRDRVVFREGKQLRVAAPACTAAATNVFTF
jgi:hypothetical protein